MLDENTGADATISDEELELDLTPDGTEDVEALAEKLKNAEKAKKQILARAKKAEEELKTLKTPPPTQTITKEEPKEDSDEKLWEIADMIREGYTKADADFISRNGGKEALKDPNSYVSIALSRIKEQRAAEIAASQTGNQSGASEVERKYTEEQLRAMPLEKLKEILPHSGN
jgi:hypothetical protein